MKTHDIILGISGLCHALRHHRASERQHDDKPDGILFLMTGRHHKYELIESDPPFIVCTLSHRRQWSVG